MVSSEDSLDHKDFFYSASPPDPYNKFWVLGTKKIGRVRLTWYFNGERDQYVFAGAARTITANISTFDDVSIGGVWLWKGRAAKFGGKEVTAEDFFNNYCRLYGDSRTVLTLVPNGDPFGTGYVAYESVKSVGRDYYRGDLGARTRNYWREVARRSNAILREVKE